MDFASLPVFDRDGENSYRSKGQNLILSLHPNAKHMTDPVNPNPAQNSLTDLLDEIERGRHDYSEDNSIRIGSLIRTRGKLVKALRRALHFVAMTPHIQRELIGLLREPAEDVK